MSDDVKALMERAREFAGWLEPSEEQTAELIRALADALKAAQQAPAVDREALVKFIAENAGADWLANSPSGLVNELLASGILQDAMEVEARGLEKAAEGFTANGQVSNTPLFSRADVARFMRARAQQVREGK